MRVTVSVLMFLPMSMLMTVYMRVLMKMSMTVPMSMMMFLNLFRIFHPMQICHIMIVILMLRIQINRKITGVQSGFLHSADRNRIPVQFQTLKRPF